MDSSSKDPTGPLTWEEIRMIAICLPLALCAAVGAIAVLGIISAVELVGEAFT